MKAITEKLGLPRMMRLRIQMYPVVCWQIALILIGLWILWNTYLLTGQILHEFLKPFTWWDLLKIAIDLFGIWIAVRTIRRAIIKLAYLRGKLKMIRTIERRNRI